MSLQNKVKQDYKIANLIICIKHFKATLEFSNSHADVVKAKMYESVRQEFIWNI